jgi:hypothetical protein
MNSAGGCTDLCVIARSYAKWLVMALTGEAADRNKKRVLAAIARDNTAAVPDESGANPSEEQLLDTLDRLYPTWFERATGEPGAKRERRA